MVTARNVEHNTIYSFNRLKNDVKVIARWVAWNKREHEALKEKIEKLQKQLDELQPKRFVASKKSRKVHAVNCMHSKRIKEVNKTYFDILRDAKMQGFEACACT